MDGVRASLFAVIWSLCAILATQRMRMSSVLKLLGSSTIVIFSIAQASGILPSDPVAMHSAAGFTNLIRDGTRYFGVKMVRGKYLWAHQSERGRAPLLNGWKIPAAPRSQDMPGAWHITPTEFNSSFHTYTALCTLTFLLNVCILLSPLTFMRVMKVLCMYNRSSTAVLSPAEEAIIATHGISVHCLAAIVGINHVVPPTDPLPVEAALPTYDAAFVDRINVEDIKTDLQASVLLQIVSICLPHSFVNAIWQATAFFTVPTVTPAAVPQAPAPSATADSFELPPLDELING
jgi:hypothetical protein